MLSRRPTFFAKRSARLAARLQLMTWCWRFSRQVGGRVVVLWVPLPGSAAAIDGADYHPSMIFDLAKFYAEGGAEDLVFLEGSAKEPADCPSIMAPYQDAGTVSGDHDPDILKREARIYVEHLPVTARVKGEPDGDAYLRQSLRETWARLPYHATITGSLASIMNIIGDDYLALHVRRGDVIQTLRSELPSPTTKADRFASIMRAYLTRVAPLASYDEAVDDAIGRGRKILYLSDSPDSAMRFTDRFGARHFILADRFAKERPAIQKAFIDFNLMVRASEVISTSSIYSHFAATLGANRLLNVVPWAPLDAVRRELHEVHLAGVDLGADERRRVDRELERQHGAIVAGIAPDFAPPPLPLK